MNKEQLKEEARKITSVDLFITEECNLNCSYCFHKQTSDKLTLEQGKKILDRLHELNSEKMSITFFGGEPLLYPQLVYDLSVYAKSLWKDTQLHISTNGTYFDEEMFKKYKELEVSMQVSFDGDEETQEKNRGQFELVRDNIVKMLDIYPNLVVRMTYNPETVGFLSKNVQFIHKLGVVNIMHHATMEREWSEEDLKEYVYQLQNIYNYRRFCHRNGIPLFVHFADKTMKVLNDDAPTELEFCMAGKSYFGILSNGDVYPCHRAASNRIFKLGNLFNPRPVIRGIFSAINKEYTKCTKSCEAWRTCHTCIITNFLVNKDLCVPLYKNRYCDICRIEHNTAKAYLNTEISDKHERLLNKIGAVVADISDGIISIEEKLEKR